VGGENWYDDFPGCGIAIICVANLVPEGGSMHMSGMESGFTGNGSWAGEDAMDAVIGG